MTFMTVSFENKDNILSCNWSRIQVIISNSIICAKFCLKSFDIIFNKKKHVVLFVLGTLFNTCVSIKKDNALV
jgi:hypothetical protein